MVWAVPVMGEVCGPASGSRKQEVAMLGLAHSEDAPAGLR